MEVDDISKQKMLEARNWQGGRLSRVVSREGEAAVKKEVRLSRTRKHGVPGIEGRVMRRMRW